MAEGRWWDGLGWMPERPSHWLDSWLQGWSWWRRRRGGHWELWMMDFPVAGDCWFKPVVCSREAGGRVVQRPGLGFMLRGCEG